MNEPKIMKQLHSEREANYERMKRLSVKERIISIQSEAEPLKKRLIEKMKKRETPITQQ
ncbi:MAG: hypothetical protein HY809_01435 [Nitrospirae bacterium]|nr:hypothetical protein [Nitrospirota bacterium]